MARGADLRRACRLRSCPLLAGVRDWRASGFVTGASGRNWAATASDVTLAGDVDAASKALLTDPQTSGGLLVSCSAEVVGRVLDTFKRHGFHTAAEVGEVVAHDGAARLVVR